MVETRGRQLEHAVMFRRRSSLLTLFSIVLFAASACGSQEDDPDPSGDGDGDGDAGDGDGDLGDGDGDAGDGDGDPGDGGMGGMGGTLQAPRKLVVAEGLDEPTGITVDDQYVYWADRVAGTVARCPLDGCNAAAPEIIIDGLTAPSGLHLSGDMLYLTSSAESGDRQIFGCQLAECGSGVTLLGNLGAGGHELSDVTERDGTLYYGNWPSFGSCSAEGCLQSGLTPFGGAPVVSVATDEDYVYSARHGWGNVSRCSLPDCTDVAVLVEVSTPLGVAVFEDMLYFGQHNINGLFAGGAGGQWGIYSCSTDGCDFDDATVVEYGEISPYALAISGDYLYFTNVNHGTVVRVER